MSIQTVYRAGASYTLAAGATSVASSATMAVGVQVIRLCATVACWVAIGPSPTATTSSIYLQANFPEYFRVAANSADKVAVLDAGTAGTLSITEMTQ